MKSISLSTFRANRNLRMIISCQSVNVKNGLTSVTHSNHAIDCCRDCQLSKPQSKCDERRKQFAVDANEKKTHMSVHNIDMETFINDFLGAGNERKNSMFTDYFSYSLRDHQFARAKGNQNLQCANAIFIFFALRTFFDCSIKFHNIIHTWPKTNVSQINGCCVFSSAFGLFLCLHVRTWLAVDET